MLVFGSVAGAADLPRKMSAPPPPPPPVYSWTGCYIAGGIGYGLYDINHIISSPGAPVFGVAQASDNGGRGWLGTVGVGCDLQFASPFGGNLPFLGGNWLVGVLADFDWMNIKGNYTTNCPSGCAGPFSFTGELKERNAVYVGARLGWVVTPQLLTYVSGGWTRTRFDGATLLDSFGGTAVAALPAQNFNGWFLGGGTEYALGWLPGLYWRSEYRFADYRSESTTVACISGNCNTLAGINAIDNAHPYVQTVRSELVWRFSWR
jgi:outer membrane immunogenic protein